MAILSAEELLEIKRWIRTNNEYNPSIKFFVNIQEDVLLSIEARVFEPKWTVRDDKIDEIYRGISVISHQSLIPEKTGDIKHGIIKMNISYTNPYWSQRHIIRGLTLVRDDMKLI